MAYYLINRLVQFVAVLAFLSIIVFTIIRLIPGDPAAVMLGTEATPEVLAQIRHEMGLDQPIPVQYLKWLQNVAAGNFGTSWVSKKPALQLILGALPVTLQLVGCSFFIALLIAFPAGLFSALRPRSWVDQGSTTFALLGISLPSFWLGIMLILLFSLQFRWLPPSGYVAFTTDPAAALKASLLPSVTLGVALAAPLTRFIRSGMLDVLGLDYIRTARAKGVAEGRVIAHHALRNALLSVVTVLGLQLGGLLGGSIVIEQVFGWPGIGRLSLAAIQ
ncbi:MAG TPA: ABC transporter permease, partial [Candidatus Baltobacteraceae bacterium]|nr:ABC transporter permease [Candidatus Baltobacteraceae bacterium]